MNCITKSDTPTHMLTRKMLHLIFGLLPMISLGVDDVGTVVGRVKLAAQLLIEAVLPPSTVSGCAVQLTITGGPGPRHGRRTATE